MKRSYITNSLLALGSLLFAALLAEGILQGYGLILDNGRPEPKKINSSAVRILAIGESTTDAASAPDKKPWTWFLEKQFTENGLNVEIANYARLGTSTPILMRDLNQQILDEKPHVIIAMMGINDTQNLSYLHDGDFISKIKLVRIFRSMLQTGKVVASEAPDPNLGYKFKLAIKKLKHVGENSAEINAMIKRHPEHEWFIRGWIAHQWFNIGLQNPLIMRDSSNLRYVLDMASSSLKLNPHNEMAVRMLLFSSHASRETARNVFKDILKKGYQPSPVAISWLGKINFHEDEELNNLLKAVGISSDKRRSIETTRENYFKLHQMAKAANIKLVIMGYPATDIEIYKSLFDPEYKFILADLRGNLFLDFPKAKLSKKFEDIVFVDNSSMPKHFDRTVYTDLMVSTPKGGFGHTTLKGHQMIANNVFNTLLKRLPGLFPQKKLHAKSDKF